MEFSNIWSEFKTQLKNLFSVTPSPPDAETPTLGRVYLTDTIKEKQSVNEGVAVTPTGVLDLVVMGSYTGETTSDNIFQTVKLGFKPRAVLISAKNAGFVSVGKNITTYSEELRGGLVIGDAACLYDCAQNCDDGFKVCNKNGSAELNYNGREYLYIAYR